MAAGVLEGVAATIPAQDHTGLEVVDHTNFMQKYNEERNRRTREDGLAQYIDLINSDEYKHFLADPNVAAGTPVHRPVPAGGQTKVLIVGAGFGGLLFAVKLIQAGFTADGLLLVDPAGGFGGTWWYNRYPGLMCDTESYIYLPLLEEMGYMPKRKYSSGSEIREYSDSIATKYNLHARTMFQSSAGQNMIWDDDKKQWLVKISEKPKGGPEQDITVKADFVVIASGLLANVKLPDLPGLDSFEGEAFHTSRWNYSITGGSPEDPT